VPGSTSTLRAPSNCARVLARSDDEVVFEAALIAVVHEIDAVEHVGARDARVGLRFDGEAVRLCFRAAIVANHAGQRIGRDEPRRALRADDRHAERRGAFLVLAAERERDIGIIEIDAVVGATGREPDGAVELSLVVFETERTLAERLRDRTLCVCGHGTRGPGDRRGGIRGGRDLGARGARDGRRLEHHGQASRHDQARRYQAAAKLTYSLVHDL
jgi:hypothetical protein